MLIKRMNNPEFKEVFNTINNNIEYAVDWILDLQQRNVKLLTEQFEITKMYLDEIKNLKTEIEKLKNHTKSINHNE